MKVHLKMRPSEEIEVSEHEANVLRGQGILIEETDPAEAETAPRAASNSKEK